MEGPSLKKTSNPAGAVISIGGGYAGRDISVSENHHHYHDDRAALERARVSKHVSTIATFLVGVGTAIVVPALVPRSYQPVVCAGAACAFIISTFLAIISYRREQELDRTLTQQATLSGTLTAASATAAHAQGAAIAYLVVAANTFLKLAVAASVGVGGTIAWQTTWRDPHKTRAPGTAKAHQYKAPELNDLSQRSDVDEGYPPDGAAHPPTASPGVTAPVATRHTDISKEGDKQAATRAASRAVILPSSAGSHVAAGPTPTKEPATHEVTSPADTGAAVTPVARQCRSFLAHRSPCQSCRMTTEWR